MEALARILILFGIASSFLAQFIGMVLAFKDSVLKGILIFIIPSYIILALKANGHYFKVIGLWLAGIVVMIAGIAVLPRTT